MTKMRLEIYDKNEMLDPGFARWILRQAQLTCFTTIHSGKLRNWTSYLQKSSSLVPIGSTHPSAETILLQGAKSLQISVCTPASLVIEINPNAYAQGYDRVRLASLCKLLNYGNTEIHGCAVFTRAFEQVIQKLPEYVTFYYGV